MGIRLSGMISGMDTESIVKELMTAHNLKKTKIENKITKHEWKQEKWKELNTKIYALYTGTLSKMKTQGSYLTKKASTSDETKLTASATSGATNGTHRVRVDKLASSQYVTGAKLGDVLDEEGETKKVSGSTKLTQLGFAVEADRETVIQISGTKDVSLAVTAQTTVSDFVNACQSAGLNANYDAAQKRFFISSKESGAENAFSITTSTAGDTAAKNELRELAGYDKLNSAKRAEFEQALEVYKNGDIGSEEYDNALDTIHTMVADQVSRDLTEEFKTSDAFEEQRTQAEQKAEEEYRASLKEDAEVDDDALEKAKTAAVEKAAADYVKQVREDFENGATDGNPYYAAAQELGTKLAAYESAPSDAAGAIDGNTLDKLGLGEITYTVGADGAPVYSTTGSFSLVEAADSVIEYNGAILTGSSNSITANGLTLNLNAVTKGTANEYISVNVTKDNQAVYDMVKSFIKEYNDVLDELNTAYNASSARGYEPLTDDEREAMTEEQIEKWETKIKDSLLRRDDTLNGVLNAMKSAMMSTAEYNGAKYSLATFGIQTTDYTEYGKLHIYGDADDTTVAGQKDKLMAAIDEDPDKVMHVLSDIAGKLYEAMGDRMKSTNMSSAFTVYNDKQMTKDLKTYKKELTTMEDRLNDMEDRYYKQFTAMESAMAKLNSQTNSLSAMLGM